MSVYEKIYLSVVSGDSSTKYYFTTNTTIDSIDGWGMANRRINNSAVLDKDGYRQQVGGYDGQSVNINFYMELSSYEDLWTEKDSLNAFLRCSELKIVREELGRYMIGTFISDGWSERADDEGLRVTGSLQFNCPDPFKYSVDDTTYEFKGFTHSGQNFLKQVYTSGNYHVLPTVYVSGVVGSLSTFSITNQTNNTRIGMKYDLNVGKFVYVDNDDKNVYASGGLTITKYSSPDSEFLRFDPGSNVLFMETDDSNSGEFSASFDIFFTDRWL